MLRVNLYSVKVFLELKKSSKTSSNKDFLKLYDHYDLSTSLEMSNVYLKLWTLSSIALFLPPNHMDRRFLGEKTVLGLLDKRNGGA